MPAPSTNRALADFLRSRRARIEPDPDGDTSHGRRQVTGLRRSEVAARAGISPDYYRRLEQGRAGTVSDSVLTGVARALRLNADERRYLIQVSRPAVGRLESVAPQTVDPQIDEVLDALSLQPSVVVGRCMDVLACNALASVVFTDFEVLPPEDRNVARFLFLDPVARDRHVDWDRTAKMAASMLSRQAAERPDDPRLHALLEDLLGASDAFRALWAERLIGLRGDGRREMRHPAVGDYRLLASAFPVPGDPDQLLVIHTAKRRSRSETALRRLAQLADDAGPASGITTSG